MIFSIVFFATLFLSILLTRLMMRVNISAVPTQRSSHKNPTPAAGGVAFTVAFCLGFLFVYYSPLFAIDSSILQKYILYYGLAALIVTLVSLRDDYKSISYRIRLLTHFISVLLLVYGGLIVEFPSFGNDINVWGPSIFTVFALMSLINGANFIDGLDGLLSGCIIISLVFQICLIWPADLLFVAFYSLLLAALLGFFIFNFPKAKIFMGDIGSTFLGLTLGFSAIIAQKYYPFSTDTALIHKGFIYSLTPLSFLWFDVAFTLLRRAYLGNRLTEAHRDHLIHILNDCGYSHALISSLYFISVVVMGSFTLLSHYSYINFMTFFFIYVVLQTCFCAWVFHQKRRHHKLKFT